MYVQILQWNPSIRTLLNDLNQDTMQKVQGPCYIEQCTKLPPEMRTPPLIRVSGIEGFQLYM